MMRAAGHCLRTRLVLVLALALVLSCATIPGANGKIGVAFSGGGFRSHASFAGVVSGLMSRTGDTLGSSGDQKLGNLLGNVDSFGSNSGGTWFFSHMGFSKVFVQALNVIAERQHGFETAYGRTFIKPLLALADDQSDFPDWLFHINDEVNWLAILQILKDAPDGSTLWTTIVKLILESVGDVSATDMKISSPTNAWAHMGQSWVVQGSMNTPGRSGGGTIEGYAQLCLSNSSQLDQPHNDTDSADGISPHSLVVQVDEDWASAKSRALPISFSAKLGREDTSSQPTVYKFSYQHPFQTEWQLHRQPSKWQPAALIGKMTQSHSSSIDLKQRDTRTLSLLHTNAVSSCIGGGPVNMWDQLPKAAQLLLRIEPQLYKKLLDMAIYFSAAEHDFANAFTKGESTRSPESADSSCAEWLQHASVHGQSMVLGDGGFVDNNGAAQLLQNPEITSLTMFVDTKPLSKDDPKKAGCDPRYGKGEFRPDLLALFSGYDPLEGISKAAAYYPVFNTTVDEMIEAVGQAGVSKTLPSLEGKNKYFSEIRYYSLDVVTREQPHWNIAAGRTIRLNVVNVDVDLGIGALDLMDYSFAVEEIAHALYKTDVRDLYAFLGAGDPRPAPAPTPTGSATNVQAFPRVTALALSILFYFNMIK